MDYKTTFIDSSEFVSQTAKKSADGVMFDEVNRIDFESQAFPQLEGLYRTAFYMSGDDSVAQDMVRNSYVRAYALWHKGQGIPDYRIWLFKIMANVLFNKYRPFSDLPLTVIDADEIDGYQMYSRWVGQQKIDRSAHNPLSAISGDVVEKAIRDLPGNFRLIVILSMLEHFSYREIADIADIDLETVRSGLLQGRKLMQRALFDKTAVRVNATYTAGRLEEQDT